MKCGEVAENVKQLVEHPPAKDEFIFDLLLAYGTPKATIARLKAGQLNLAKEPGEVLLKKKVFFKALTTEGAETQSGSGHEKAQEGTKNNRRKSVQSADEKKSLLGAIEEMKTAKAVKTNDPRFLIVTDFSRILAVDRKTNDTLDIDFEDLKIYFDFFLPWAGMEKTKLSNENPADVKAAEKMAKLFDAIKQDNPDYLRHDAHAMNVFLARLLFCLFAEDTGIFPENAVSNAMASHTAEDGSDLDAFFKQLFDWLDTSDESRISNTSVLAQRLPKEAGSNANGNEPRISKGLDHAESEAINNFAKQNSDRQGNGSSHESHELKKHLIREIGANSRLKNNQILGIQNLPYVNGGLFRDHYDIPQFSGKSRRMLIEAGSLNWSEINPDIFGSMFQAVIDPEERHNLGQHYTSVTNIMKVIEPLFLNDFKEELERARNLSQKNVRTKALNDLHDRLAKVKIFDPACGSGNFLIIAYKELRKLEMELFEAQNAFPVSRITVDQFYGIEIDDFACETATLSLWLAEHQMNLEYQKRFKQSLTSLPLKDGAHIVCGNACRLDWENVCPKNKNDEIYILGNPPYLGARMQNEDQKSDLARVFTGIKEHKNLDYIACWFWKGAQYIQQANAQCAFVSTNSICQGEQVALLWPHIFSKELEISFAHQSFKWTNNAKNSAAVICVIVGIRNQTNEGCLMYRAGLAVSVKKINPYLVAGSCSFIGRRAKPLSLIAPMPKGNMPYDGGQLILSTAEKESLLLDYPSAARFIRRLLGSAEYIQGLDRWCLWMPNQSLSEALAIGPIRERVAKVKEVRLASPDGGAKKLAQRPHQFRETLETKKASIIIPSVSSERREYIPIGFVGPDTIVTNLAFVIYDQKPFLLGILSSKMHMAWMRITCGRLKTDYRYSSHLCYNTFPIPNLTEEQKQTITMHVAEVLEEREKHPEKTMAQLYDPDKMPAGLREAHHQLDLAVDRLYRSRPFTSDEERLEHLFKLYEEMAAEEQLI